MKSLAAFLSELKRRRVFRVAAVYAGVAFIISEIVANTFEYLGIPTWIIRTIIYVLILGFPIALALGWIYDITDKGIVRTAASAGDQDKKVNITRLIGVGTVLLIGVVLVLGTYVILRPQELVATPHVKPSVAVLYFDNITGSEEGEIWSTGLTEGVITALTKLGKLDVKSRLDVLPYKGQTPDHSRIYDDLAVDAILVSSLQLSGDRLRANANLVDASTGNNLWGETYDGTTANPFAFEDTLSFAVATALGVELATIQEDILAARPTKSTLAFEWASNGLYFFDREMYQDALAYFDSALAVDPTYTRAHYYRGQVLHELERYEDAMAAYKRALPGSEQFDRVLWEWSKHDKDSEYGWLFHESKPIAVTLDYLNENHRLLAVDLSNGELKWEVTLPTDYGFWDPLPWDFSDESTGTFPSSMEEFEWSIHGDRILLLGGESNTLNALLLGYHVDDGRELFRRSITAPEFYEEYYVRFGSIPQYMDGFTVLRKDGPVGLFTVLNDSVTFEFLDPQSGTALWIWDRVLPELRIEQFSIIEVKIDGMDYLYMQWYLEEGRQSYLIDGTTGVTIREWSGHDVSFLAGDAILLEADSTWLTAINLLDGTKLWEYRLQSPVLGSIPNCGDLSILALENETLIALNPGKTLFGLGRRKWEIDITEELSGLVGFWPPPNLYGNQPQRPIERIIFSSDTTGIYIVELNTGKVNRFQADFTTTAIPEPRWSRRDRYLLATSETHHFLTDSMGSAILWQSPKSYTGGEVYGMTTSLALIQGGPSLISALDLEYGTFRWNFHTGDVWFQTWIPDGRDRLFVGMYERLVEVNLMENPEESLIREKDVLVRLAESATELGLYEEAEGYLASVLERIDPAFPPAHKATAEIHYSAGRELEAAMAMARYHDLFPPDHPEAVYARNRLMEEGDLLWFTSRGFDLYSNPIIDKERTYLRSLPSYTTGSDGQLVAISNRSGEVLWELDGLFLGETRADDVPNGHLFITSLSIRDELVRVISLQKKTGMINWEEELDPNSALLGVYGDLLVFRGANGMLEEDEVPRLFALLVATGEVVWERIYPWSEYWRAAGLENYMFITTGEASPTAAFEFVDPATGNTEWIYHKSNPEEGYQLDNRANVRFLGLRSRGNQYISLDLEEQHERWNLTFPFQLAYGSQGTWECGDTLFVWTLDSLLAFVIHEEEYKTLWSISVPSHPGILSVDADWLYIRCDVYSLTRLNRDTGFTDREYLLPWGASFTPTIGYGIGVFRSTSSQNVYAISLE